MSTHLRFTHIGTSKSGKTNIVGVATAQGLDPLGTIQWYAPWRRYAFYPLGGTLFDVECLIDIAAHIKQMMKERKRG